MESASLEAQSSDLWALVPDPVVDRVLENARSAASNRQVGVRVVRASMPLCLHGNAALHSAIENVLRNALRFASTGSEVVVAMRPDA